MGDEVKDRLIVYDGEPVDLVALAIKNGCVIPEMKRVCGGKSWAIYACVDLNEETKDTFEPVLWIAGDLPYSKDDKAKKAGFEARIKVVVDNFLRHRPWMSVKDYRGAC